MPKLICVFDSQRQGLSPGNKWLKDESRFWGSVQIRQFVLRKNYLKCWSKGKIGKKQKNYGSGPLDHDCVFLDKKANRFLMDFIIRD